MLIPAKHKCNFYQMVSGNVVKPGRMLPTDQHKDGGYTGLVSVASRCALLAMTALDLNLGLDRARAWLAEAAACYIDMQNRTGRSTGFMALRTTFRIGTCHDASTLEEWSRKYLSTPYGSDWNKANTQPENHYWHFAHVLALFHVGEQSRLESMLEDLTRLGPCKGWKHSADWFDAMRSLAVEALAASEPSVAEKLAAVAEINQSMFAPKSNAGFYEAWFAELAMAFVPAALARGWTIGDAPPHSSMPLGLFRLSPLNIRIRPWSELAGLGPSEELAAAISAAAAPEIQRKKARKSQSGKLPTKQ